MILLADSDGPDETARLNLFLHILPEALFSRTKFHYENMPIQIY